MSGYRIKSAEEEKLAVTTENESGTRALGAVIGDIAEGGLCIALTGVLGSGKTRLVKGIAEGLGIADSDGVTSPTYIICAEYAGRLTLYHFDAYRLHGAAEFEDAAGDMPYNAKAVSAIEWAERVEGALPEDRIEIQIEITGETDRDFGITATGEKSHRVLKKLSESL
ncbi:MAG: tRNA (adenosine(37)-N6)-threonylcarbamoyltransferase complex ATPase subunit type 1 TsaE [Planctomycetota bacterium]|jgi:tRNA threonylcarbamoyladenosine biosynthesis protein TsaE